MGGREVRQKQPVWNEHGRMLARISKVGIFSGATAAYFQPNLRFLFSAFESFLYLYVTSSNIVNLTSWISTEYGMEVQTAPGKVRHVFRRQKIGNNNNNNNNRQ